MKLEHGKLYYNCEGTCVRITKGCCDNYYVGHSAQSGVFMGYYTEMGFKVDGTCDMNLLMEA